MILYDPVTKRSFKLYIIGSRTYLVDEHGEIMDERISFHPARFTAKNNTDSRCNFGFRQMQSSELMKAHDLTFLQIIPRNYYS